MAKEQKKDQIFETNMEHPRKKIKRQRDSFYSTKKKRKTARTTRKFVKPTREQKELFYSTSEWEKPLPTKELQKTNNMEITEGKQQKLYYLYQLFIFHIVQK